MKKYLLSFILVSLVSLTAFRAAAQDGLLADQNPNFAVSRDKYMRMADSINEWHSTTPQETYKAIDWLVDRKEARVERREFRRQLQRDRLWADDSYYGNYYSYPYYRGNRGNYGYYYQRGYNRRGGSFYINPWGAGYRWH